MVYKTKIIDKSSTSHPERREGSLPSVGMAFLLVLIILGLNFLIIHFVFSGRVVLPQTFSIGFITIHYYGAIMALAVASAFYLALKRSAEFKITNLQAEDLLLWLIIGGFLGARIYHVVSSAPYYINHPLAILKVWNGGLSIYGAVLGGLVTIWLYKRLVTCNLSLATILDWLTPSLIVGQVIGRFGNLFNYEAYGYPTNLPWKMFVPEIFRPEIFQNFSFFHPFFLYEALGNLCILFFLLKFIQPKYASQKPGQLFFSYLLLYNTLRFALEFLRIDSTFIGFIRLNALVSFVLIIVSLSLFFWNVSTFKHNKIS
jgi:phosphatidylglycerol:prolipoprotein diacylglycerol transferase